MTGKSSDGATPAPSNTETLIREAFLAGSSRRIALRPAYLDDEKFKKMKEYGADMCFSKPLPLPQLKKEVARLLGVPTD